MRYLLPRIHGSMAGYGEGSRVNRNATQIAARISRCRDVFQKAVRDRRKKNIKTRESYVVSLDDVTREWLQSRLEAIEEITDKDVLEKDSLSELMITAKKKVSKKRFGITSGPCQNMQANTVTLRFGSP